MNYSTYLRWGVLGGLFSIIVFVPFLIATGGFLPSMFFPFITAKNFAFRIIVELVFLLYVLLAIREPQYRPKSSNLMWAVFAFVAWMGIATIFSVDPIKSFWSNFERMDGYITLIHLFAMFVVAGAILPVGDMWKRFLQTSVGASVIMGIYGLFQILGIVEISSQSGSRVDTTFGNALYTGVYMLFNIFITLFLLVRDSRSKTMQVVYGLALVLQVTTLFYTQSRGPALGLIGGLIFAALYIGIFAKGAQWQFLRKASWIGLGAIVALVLIVFAARETQFIQNSDAFSRIANVSLQDATVQSRLLYIWPMVYQGFLERPITGWGQENFSYVFNKNYPPQMYNQEQWFDRAHNQFLDWLVAGGLLAFLLYISFFILAAWAIYRSDKLLVPEQAVLLGLLAAYAFNNSFVFDNIISAVYFYLILAFLHSLSWKPLPRFMFLSKPGDDRVVAIAAPVVAVVMLAGFWIFNVNGIARAQTLIEALSPTDPLTGASQTSQERFESFKRALSQGELGKQETVEQLFQYASSVAGSTSESVEFKQSLYTLARTAGNEIIAERPGDARIESFMGIFLAQFGELDDALVHLRRAEEYSPNKQSILFQLGEVLLRKGETREALEVFKRAFELAPEYDMARMMYVGTLHHVGQAQAGDDLLIERYGTINIDDDQMIRIYQSLGLHNRVVEIWKTRVERNPQNSDILLGLASAYFAAGDTANTIAVLRRVSQLRPETAGQIEQLISQLQNGILRPQ